MAWTAPKTWTVGEVLTAANLNAQVRDNELMLSMHVHSGAAGDGGSSLGPLVKADFTDATAPDAPSAGQTRLFSVGGRIGARANGGAAKVLVDQDTSETLTNKTLTSPVINTSLTGTAVGTGASQVAAGNHTHSGLFTVVLKTGDETVNNSDTLQNDDTLAFAVTANKTYQVRLVLRYNSGSAADFKLGWSLPAGASFHTTFQGYNTSSAWTAGEWKSSVQSLGGIGADAIAIIEGVIIVAGTGGTAQFQWAQNTTDASDTKVLANSVLLYSQLN